MKGLLEYLKIENVSHPAPSDIEIGLKTNEDNSKVVSKFISTVFENETVTFICNNNGIENYMMVVSETKQMQFKNTPNTNNYSYIIKDTNNMLLESKNDVCKKFKDFKNTFTLYGEEKGWNKRNRN